MVFVKFNQPEYNFKSGNMLPFWEKYSPFKKNIVLSPGSKKATF
jgi:hypothetical protein